MNHDERMIAQHLRTRLAGQALQGLLACENLEVSPQRFAELAVQHADALIAELNKPAGGCQDCGAALAHISEANLDALLCPECDRDLVEGTHA